MVRIFNFTTFDTMSDMCFGKTFGLLESNEYSEWVNAVFQSVKMLPMIQVIEYYPALKFIYNLLEPKVLSDMKMNHFKHSANLVDERLTRGSDQPDIWNMVMSAESDGKGLTLDEMHSNAGLFMIAGTETTGKSERPRDLWMRTMTDLTCISHNPQWILLLLTHEPRHVEASYQRDTWLFCSRERH